MDKILSKNKIDIDKLISMELEFLNVIGYYASLPTILTFLDLFSEISYIKSLIFLGFYSIVAI